MYRVVKERCDDTGKQNLFSRLSGKTLLVFYRDKNKSGVEKNLLIAVIGMKEEVWLRGGWGLGN
jgi:hypothetical protein